MTLKEFTAAFEEIVMVDPGTVNLDTDLSSLDDWDSLSKIALLSKFEESFRLKLTEEDLKGKEKFSDIVNMIKAYLEN